MKQSCYITCRLYTLHADCTQLRLSHETELLHYMLTVDS
jgi:hypothetical protein